MRPIPPESSYAGTRFDDPVMAQRRRVLRETLDLFVKRGGPELRAVAAANLQRWRSTAVPAAGAKVQVLPGDWGDVTMQLTRQHGRCFAVLNMANAFHPGGAYVEGTAAQEENMFRRTDCHYTVPDGDYDRATSELISGTHGRVMLDTSKPRVVVRGSEDRQAPDLGYRWLKDDELFPFFELRAAAVDLRKGGVFNPAEARRRIAAQLDTIIDAGVRHAVLGAFGCGAFKNPTAEVAKLYREELAPRLNRFELVAFAIFDAGYGPDNFGPFASEFQQPTLH